MWPNQMKSALSSQFIPVDGVKLHVADWGGSGPDLLLLHANGFLG